MLICFMSFSFQLLKNEILKDRYNSVVFEKGRGKDIYLVGGYVRDLLMGVYSHDRDYIVCNDIKPFVSEIKEITGGTLVELRKKQMFRIAFKDGTTLDFSRPLGTIEEDLSKRDFTMNAIAWSPEKGIIDIYHGIKDIHEKRIRSLSEKNLIDDPLRMLRAYRFAAELKGFIEVTTRTTIKKNHKNIKKITSERITLEMFNFLNQKDSAQYLEMAVFDKLLTDLLSIPSNRLNHNIKAIYKLENRVLDILPSTIKVLLKNIFSQGLSYKGLLCLELLLFNNSKVLLTKDFKMKMSTLIRKRLELAHKGIMELKKNRLHIQEQLFDIFLISKEAAMDILIITGKIELLKDYMRFKKILKVGLLSSEEIISTTGVKPGPQLGRIVIELKRAQFEGRVKSKLSALRFISKIKTESF
ncbi:MAG: CCA tRNA nucleotidyltransferase [Nitrospira sp.]|nr:CCA tRNA nucleotidyltransferase [Nitrospira sp.]